MEPVFDFDYADWLGQQQVAKAPSTVASESEADVEKDADDNVYEYQPMKDPEHPYTFQQGLALYPAQYTYAQPQQVQVAQPAPKAVAAPKPAPAPAQITYQYPQPYGYAAYPVQVAMPNYPVPVPEPKQSAAKIKDKPKVEEAEKKEEGAKPRAWIGRTTKQVDEDNVRMAINEGLYKPNDIVPKGARDDQLFWCIETDGSNTLRTFRTIEDDMHPGKWKVDPRYGSLYFVREKEKEKEKKK